MSSSAEGRFSGKVVLVTGGGSGMGRAIVAEFASEGAKVAAVDIRLDSAEETVAGLSDPSRAVALQCDVADPESVARCVDSVLQWGGRIDVLCNNAGIVDSFAPPEQVSVEEWSRVIGVNLTGPFLMARAVIPDMLSRSSGVIINTGSTSSFSSAGGGSAYTASKHGLLGLTRQWAFDLGAKGIRTNMICPGATNTPLATQGLGEGEFFPDTDSIVDKWPAGRWCEPWEIAKLVVYLASDDAGFFHGSAVVIDGGWLAAAREAY